MKLIPNWKVVTWRAWSMRFMGLALVAQTAGEVVPLFTGEDLSFGWLTIIAIISTAFGAVSRVIDQNLEDYDDPSAS